MTGGSKSFSTYTFIDGLRNAGVGMVASDIVGGLWTPDQSWINFGSTFSSLSMNAGTFAVSDALTGESITIQVGASVVPLPFGLPLLGSALLIGAVPAFRRRGARPA